MVEGFYSNARSTYVRTNQADIRVVWIVVELGVGPSDRTSGTVFVHVFAIVDGADSNNARESAGIDFLVRVQPWWRAVARCSHVVRNRDHCHLTVVADSNGSDHSELKSVDAGVT